MEKFGAIFKTDNPIMPTSLENLDFQSISPKANANLIKIPSKTEIKASVDALHPLKAPGPDGFPSIFYLHYWETVNSQVISSTQECFRT